MALPAGAAPFNSQKAIVFPFVTCTPLQPGLGNFFTSFTVQGNGSGPVFLPDGSKFQPYSLQIFFNGTQVDGFFKAPLVPSATYECSGTVKQGPIDDPVVTSFVAQGVFKS
jgi:hypothetical protein